MSILQSKENGAELIVQNRTSTRTQDYLILDMTVDGQKRMFGTMVELDPGVAAHYSIEYLQSVDLPGFGLCGDRPWGIVEETEPVAGVWVD